MSDESRADLLLRAALAASGPLVRLLIQEGVTYPAFSKALKAVFVQAAHGILEEKGSKVTDSSLSVLSGVHRKDLRAWGNAIPLTTDKPLSVVSEVFTRWAVGPEYKDPSGQPMPLPKSGTTPSFESLVQKVTRDIHPRTLLDSMLQLGVVRVEQDLIHLSTEGFVPNQSEKELLSLFSDNVRDHIAAGATNLTSKQAKFLEHSVFADELTEESAKALHRSAVDIWKAAFQKFAQEATVLSDQDQGKTEAHHRLRFGVYFYAEPEQPEPNKDNNA